MPMSATSRNTNSLQDALFNVWSWFVGSVEKTTMNDSTRRSVIKPRRMVTGERNYDIPPTARHVQQRNPQQRRSGNNGMISYQCAALFLAVVAITTTPISHDFTRFLRRISNPIEDYNKPTGTEITFLLGVFSSVEPKGEPLREFMRQTYLVNTNDPRICSLNEYMSQVDDISINRRCQVAYTFVIGGGGEHRPTDHSDNEPLVLDTDHNGHFDAQEDCTYLNIMESTNDGKSRTWFKYASSLASKYGIDYIAKVDDRSILLTELFFQFQEDLPVAPFNRHIYGGSAKLSHELDMFYGAGEFYFMSSDIAYYIGHNLTTTGNQQTKGANQEEDVLVGALVWSHPSPIKFIDLQEHQMWSHPSTTWKQDNLSPRERNNQMSQKFVPREVDLFWSDCPQFMSTGNI